MYLSAKYAKIIYTKVCALCCNAELIIHHSHLVIGREVNHTSVPLSPQCLRLGHLDTLTPLIIANSVHSADHILTLQFE
jgi:hypothetical protein